MTPRPERQTTLQFLSNSKAITFCNREGVQQREIQDFYSSGLAVLNRSSFGEMTIRFFEAYAAGRVVVTNELRSESGLKELFSENRHYFIYENIEHLVEIVIQLREDEVRVRDFGREAHKIVENYHRPLHRAQELIKIVRTLI
jgi:spore maturation protein CgeB